MLRQTGKLRRKLLFASAVGVIISAWTTLGELDYVLSGRIASGKLTAIKRRIEKARYFQSGATQTVEYEFQDSQDHTHNAQDSVAMSWQAPHDGQVRVQYIANKPATSRIAGNINWGPIAAFGFSLALFAGVVVFANRQRRRERAQP